MKSFAKNYFLNLAYQALTVLLPLITAPYLSRVLGPERIGAYSFAQSVVSYFVLFAVMGTAIYGQRHIAICLAQKGNLKQSFAELVVLRALGVGGALAIYFAAIFPNADEPVLYFVAAIEILAVAFDISWFYRGIERFEEITFCNGLSKLVGAAGIFLLVKSKRDLELYVLLYCGAILLGNCLQWIYVRPYLQGRTLAPLCLRCHIKPTLSLFASQFAIYAYTVLDKTMIGLITGSDLENGYYDQAQKLIRTLIAIVTSVGTVMSSRIAILWNSREDGKEELQQMVLLSFRIVFALSLPIAVGITIIASRFVPFFYGTGYEPVIMQIQLLSVLLPIIGCSNVIGTQLFVSSGREKLLTYSVMIGAGVNFLLNSICIPFWGGNGAIVASIFAELTVTATQMYLARKEIPLRQVAKLLARYTILAAAMGIVGWGVSQMVGTTPVEMGLIILVCMIAYAAMLFLGKDRILSLFSV